MNKILLLFFLLVSLSLPAQSLKVGIKAATPVLARLETVQQTNYYFADDRNSAYSVRPDNNLKKRFVIFPRLFAQYMLNDNVYIHYEAGYSSYLMSYKIRGYNEFKNDLILDTHIDYSFITNSLFIGYKFLRTRELRPRLYSGLTHATLLPLREVTKRDPEYYLKNIEPYGQVINRQIYGITNSFFTHTIGIGIDYYILNIDVFYDYSLGKLESGQVMPLYKNYRMLTVCAGINLLGMLPNAGKVRSARNEK